MGLNKSLNVLRTRTWYPTSTEHSIKVIRGIAVPAHDEDELYKIGNEFISNKELQRRLLDISKKEREYDVVLMGNHNSPEKRVGIVGQKITPYIAQAYSDGTREVPANGGELDVILTERNLINPNRDKQIVEDLGRIGIDNRSTKDLILYVGNTSL